MSYHPGDPGYHRNGLPGRSDRSSQDYEGSPAGIEQDSSSYNLTFSTEEQGIPLQNYRGYFNNRYGSRSQYMPITPEPEIVGTPNEPYVGNDAQPLFPTGRHQQPERAFTDVPNPDTSNQVPIITLPNATISEAHNIDDQYEPYEEGRYHTNGTVMRYAQIKTKLVRAGISTVEYRVPTAVERAIQQRYRTNEGQSSNPSSTEFTHMRYTPCTCDPDDFTIKNGYNLRTAAYDRHTEMLIAVTYYNEDRVLLTRTLHSVMQNIKDIIDIKESEFWNKGGPAWQKIVVCLVFDGIDPCDKETLDVLATIGLYQDGIMVRNVATRDVVAHIFEYTTQISVTDDQQLCWPNVGENDATALPPVQMILCLKQRNSKKINSHRWVYSAFGRMLNPEICVFLDVGVKLHPRALFSVWKAFYNDRNLGAACGETSVTLQNGWKSLLNPLVAIQSFESKISSILDKPLESLFGFVNTSPGCFSAYRFRAVMGRPLEQYFHADYTLAARLGSRGMNGMSVFRKNMFLVEERVICFELASKRGARWHCSYIRSAKGETDVPETVWQFLGQRRRWFNGIFTNICYKILYFPRFYRSGHGISQQLLFHVQMVYEIIWVVLTWFSLATFFLVTRTMFATTGSFTDGANESHAWPFGHDATPVVNTILVYLYLGLLVVQFLLAYGGRPKGSQVAYKVSFAVFALIQLYVIVLLLYSIYLVCTSGTSPGVITNHGIKMFLETVFRGNIKNTIVTALTVICGLFILASILYWDMWHILTSSIQYLLLMTVSTNIMMVYAISNFHDVSWGTFGGSKAEVLPSVQFMPARGATRAAFEEADDHQTIVDTRFAEAVERALAPHIPRPDLERNASDIEDHFKNSRTCLVLAWVLSNVLVSIIVTDNTMTSFKSSTTATDHSDNFVRVLVIVTTILLLFRFLGSCWYIGWTSIWQRLARE